MVHKNLLDDEMIDQIVNKFLGWKLPKDFSPDVGIKFDNKTHGVWGGYPNSWPVGTNLLSAEQARNMFKYCLNCETTIEGEANENR